MNLNAAFINENIVVSGGRRVHVPAGVGYWEAENIILAHQSKSVRDHYFLTAQQQYLDDSLGDHIVHHGWQMNQQQSLGYSIPLQPFQDYGDEIRWRIMQCGGQPFALDKNQEMWMNNEMLERELLGGQEKKVLDFYLERYGKPTLLGHQ